MSSFHRFQVGDNEVVVLSDGSTTFPSAFLMIGVDEEERLEACARWDLDPGAVDSNINVIYIKRPHGAILFDTGAGSTMPGCGRLPEALDAAGIDVTEVDQVIHTHLHLDHVGWNVDADGNPMFPNARYCLGQTEFDFWSDPATIEALNRSELWKLPDFEPTMAAVAQRNVLALGDRIDVFPDDGEPAPGVRAIPAFGHTPGHLVFEVDLDHETLFITGDLVLSPFHLDHAQWFPAVDLHPAIAIQSRARVFNRAAELDALVFGYHLPFPGVGRVTTANDGWDWIDEFTLDETDIENSANR